MEITVDIFDKICRACLCQSADMKSLVTKTEDDKNLADILCFFGNISISLDDMFPKQVCKDCETILNMADSFKRRCNESDAYLRNVYENYLESKNFHQFDSNLVTEHENIHNKDSLSLDSCVIEIQLTEKSENLDEFSYTNTEKNLNMVANKADITKSTLPLIKEELENSTASLGSDFDDADFDSSDFATQTDSKTEMEAVILCQCGLLLSDRQAYKFHLTITNCDKIRKPKIKWLKNEVIQDITCPKCNKQFKSTLLFKTHYLSNCDQAKQEIEHINYQCSICSRKYKSKKTLASHIKRIHKSPVNHKCQRCNREFKHKAFLDNHIVSVHINDQVTCEYCGRQCLSQNELDKHREEHMEKKHQCTVCKKAFTMLCTLKDHLRTHTGEKPFLCSFCGKGFSQKNNLQQHVMRHQGNKPFKCNTCEKRFVSKGELDAHMRKHSGAHPFVCDDCGNGFTTSSSLFKHRRIHTGERPYRCDLCPMRFTASGTLKNHRRTHTGERPYQCSHCQKAFVQRNDLVSHIRCHTGERPYSCDHCGQGFRKATGLKAHLKVHGKRDGEQLGMVPPMEGYRPTLP